VLLDPGSDLGQVLVLLADVVLLAKVDEVDDGLGRKEEERVDDLDLANGKLVFADVCRVSNMNSGYIESENGRHFRKSWRY
jgi:hypothetical protein